jgi:hypothetical protein
LRPRVLPEQVGGCQLVWKDGYELHLSVPCELSAGAEKSPGPVRAAVDLGEIHQAAVSTNTGQAILISGRGIRSLKRRQNMLLGQLARKRSRCEWGSKRCHAAESSRQVERGPAIAPFHRDGLAGIQSHTNRQWCLIRLPRTPQHVGKGFGSIVCHAGRSPAQHPLTHYLVQTGA